MSDGRQDTRKRGIGEGHGLEVCLWTMKGFAFKEAGFILTHFQGTVHHDERNLSEEASGECSESRHGEPHTSVRMMLTLSMVLRLRNPCEHTEAS